MIKHLTLTGPDAGAPLCSISRKTADPSIHTFMHIPYSGNRAWENDSDICPACLSLWQSTASNQETIEEPELDGLFPDCSPYDRE